MSVHSVEPGAPPLALKEISRTTDPLGAADPEDRLSATCAARGVDASNGITDRSRKVFGPIGGLIALEYSTYSSFELYQKR